MFLKASKVYKYVGVYIYLPCLYLLARKFISIILEKFMPISKVRKQITFFFVGRTTKKWYYFMLVLIIYFFGHFWSEWVKWVEERWKFLKREIINLSTKKPKTFICVYTNKPFFGSCLKGEKRKERRILIYKERKKKREKNVNSYIIWFLLWCHHLAHLGKYTHSWNSTHNMYWIARGNVL